MTNKLFGSAEFWWHTLSVAAGVWLKHFSTTGLCGHLEVIAGPSLTPPASHPQPHTPQPHTPSLTPSSLTPQPHTLPPSHWSSFKLICPDSTKHINNETSLHAIGLIPRTGLPIRVNYEIVYRVIVSMPYYVLTQKWKQVVFFNFLRMTDVFHNPAVQYTKYGSYWLYIFLVLFPALKPLNRRMILFMSQQYQELTKDRK